MHRQALTPNAGDQVILNATQWTPEDTVSKAYLFRHLL